MSNDHSTCTFIESTREDYLRKDVDDYECHLFNHDWTPRPCIAFVENRGPVVLTCCHHNNGTKKIYLHPPRQPKHILASEKGDQFCHVVVRPRTIRPMKVSKYCTSFQMHEQRGSFKGVDTSSVTSFGDFSKSSILLDESESRLIVGRPDINALLQKLQKQNNLSISSVNAMHERATSVFPNSSCFDKYTYGCTFVPFRDAMEMQKMLATSNIYQISVILDENGGSPPQTVHCQRKRPKLIYSCQKFENFGVPFTVTPPFCIRRENKDTRLLWVIVNLLNKSKQFWIIIDNKNNNLFRQSSWEGWLLSYVASKCFSNLSWSKVQKNNPFKTSHISSIDKVAKKLDVYHAGSQDRTTCSFDEMNSLFESIKKVLFVELFGCITDFIDVDKHDAFLVKTCEDTIPEDFCEHGYGVIEIDDVEYELVSLICVSEIDQRHNWVGNVYARHGGTFKSWWFH